MNHQQFINQLKKQITSLPGEEAHALLMPINRPFTSESLQNIDDYRKSAVAIILTPSENFFSSVLIQRSSYEGVHSSQVSFPGGKMESSDPNLVFTACRECAEEINLPLRETHLIGALSQVFIPVSNFLVQPYLFFVEEMPELKAEEREVAEIIHFDVSILKQEEILQKGDIRIGESLRRKDVPYFSIEDYKVWGATAMMLSELKEILLKLD